MDYGDKVPSFLIAMFLVDAFVTGSVMALRPSPRQRQLARLRERAVASRLRVQWQPGGQGIDYVLPWDVTDAGPARTPRLLVERASGGAWSTPPGEAQPSGRVASAIGGMPVSVSRIRITPEGVAACWSESGGLSDVDEIARALHELRAALLGHP